MRRALITMLVFSSLLVSCGHPEKTPQKAEKLPTLLMSHCIIATEVGDGMFARINGQAISVVATSRKDMFRLARAVRKIPQRKSLYGRVCVKGIFAYKIGIIGHVQESPGKFIALSKFEIISADNNLDDVRVTMEEGARLSREWCLSKRRKGRVELGC